MTQLSDKAGGGEAKEEARRENGRVIHTGQTGYAGKTPRQLFSATWLSATTLSTYGIKGWSGASLEGLETRPGDCMGGSSSSTKGCVGRALVLQTGRKTAPSFAAREVK